MLQSDGCSPLLPVVARSPALNTEQWTHVEQRLRLLAPVLNCLSLLVQKQSSSTVLSSHARELSCRYGTRISMPVVCVIWSWSISPSGLAFQVAQTSEPAWLQTVCENFQVNSLFFFSFHERLFMWMILWQLSKGAHKCIVTIVKNFILRKFLLPPLKKVVFLPFNLSINNVFLSLGPHPLDLLKLLIFFPRFSHSSINIPSFLSALIKGMVVFLAYIFNFLKQHIFLDRGSAEIVLHHLVSRKVCRSMDFSIA